MPATVRRTSRTGLPGPRSEISFRWTSKAIKQLLKLIKDKPECRVTFFPTGLIQHYTKSGLARGLLLEMVKKEPEYLAWLKSEGMIKKDGEGKWIPRDTWTSTSITNPVITQMASLKRKFDTARKENKIQPEWNNFDDLPSRIRGDFKMNYPWYFQYKELSSPSGSFERPPIRPRAIRLEPVRGSTTPALAPPAARSRQRLPPSPSPSDRSSSLSSSSPSPSPSPSRSPSPAPSPSPPHVASLLPMSLTPRPNLDVQRSSSASVVPSGPRPHIRPNAVASSSRIPIKVEPSPSSSSASPASDVHLWGNSGPDQDIESEHEMENDTGEYTSFRVSMAPMTYDARAASTSTTKREYGAEFEGRNTRLSKRQRKAPSWEVEPEGSDAPSSTLQAQTSPLLRTDHDNTVVGIPLPTIATVPATRDRDLSADFALGDDRDDDDTMSDIEDDQVEGVQQTLNEDETHEEKRDRLMLQLRVASSPEDLDSVLPTILPHFTMGRREFLAAQTDQERLEILRKHRAYLFQFSLDGLRKLGSLPRCLADCQVWVDPVRVGRFKHWRRAAALAGAATMYDNEGLIGGSHSLTRIHVRRDLMGLEVVPDIFVAMDSGGQEPVLVRQYSFMAFARFYYNRICKSIDGDYESLPPPPIAMDPLSNSTLATALLSRSSVSNLITRCLPSQGDSADEGSGGNERVPRPEITPAHKARLLRQLHASVTPHQDPAVLPDIFEFRGKHADLYRATLEQEVKNKILWETQHGSAISVLRALKRVDMLPSCLAGCRVWVGSIPPKNVSTFLRQRIKAAGGVSCFSQAELMEGDPDVIRCRVEANLSGYEIGPVVFVPLTKGGSSDCDRDIARIRHYSVLAFLRFFYQRLMQVEADS